MKTKEKRTANENRTYYAVVLETIGSPEYTCMDENGNPWLFRTETDAWKEIADGMVTYLEEFINGRRELDETDFNSDEHVVPVRILNGRIIGESEGYELVHEIVKGTEINFEGSDVASGSHEST